MKLVPVTKTFFVAFIAIHSLIGCDRFYRIKGTVIDRDNLQPVHGVDIQFHFDGEDENKFLLFWKPLLTDEQGSISVSPSGQPDLQKDYLYFVKPGYVSKRVYFDEKKNEPSDKVKPCEQNKGLPCWSFSVVITPDTRMP